MNEKSDTQRLLSAMLELCEKRTASLSTYIKAALRACEVSPSYEHTDFAVAILTLSDKSNDDV